MKKLYLAFSLLTILVLPVASLGSTFVDRLFIFISSATIRIFYYNCYITERSHNIFIFCYLYLFYYFICHLVYGLYSSEWIPYKSILLDG